MAKKALFFTQSLNVTAFLGGITFASMILMIDSQDKFVFTLPSGFPTYYQLLLAGACITSILFITATVGFLRISVSERTDIDWFKNFVGQLANAGYYLFFIALLPAMLLPFYVEGAIAVFILALLLAIIARIKDPL